MGRGQANRGIMEGHESNVLPRTLESAKLCDLVLFRDGGATIPLSAFPIALFVLHASHVPELTGNRLD